MADISLRMLTRKAIAELMFAGLAALSLSGCAVQQARSPQPASGKPEVVIASRDVDGMKIYLAAEMARFGYQTEKDAPDLLQISRTTTDPITAHAVGNADSTHQRVIIYTFVKQGVSTRIVTDVFMRAQLPGGQVDTVSLNDNARANSFFQIQLDRLKETLESGRNMPQ